MTEVTATLTNWMIQDYFGNIRLIGTIVGEDSKGRFEDGTSIVTSPLLNIDFVEMRAYTHSGSVYQLENQLVRS